MTYEYINTETNLHDLTNTPLPKTLALIIILPIASPSNPSVRLTALLEPTYKTKTQYETQSMTLSFKKGK